MPCVLGIILVSPGLSRTLFQVTCLLSHSTANMSCSPTHNAGTLTPNELWTMFQRWEGSVSWEESHTLMGELISMSLSSSDGSLEVEKLMFSMSEVGTRMSSLLGEHLGRAMTTRARAEILSADDSNAQLRWDARVELAKIIQTGLESRMREIEKSFGIWYTSWIQRLQLVLTHNWPSTSTGNLLLTLPSMSIPGEYLLSMDTLMEEMIGYRNLGSEVDLL